MPIGDIGALIDSLEFDAVQGVDVSFCHVSGDIYACVYADSDHHRHFCTFSVDAAGNISGAVIDHWEDTAQVWYLPTIIKMIPGLYVVSCQYHVTASLVLTIGITDEGIIDQGEIFQLGIGSANCIQPSVIRVSSTVIAATYAVSPANGFIETLIISGAGNITYTGETPLQFTSVNVGEQSLCHIFGNVFAIVFAEVSVKGFVKTFTVGADGSLPGAMTDAYEFQSTATLYPIICLARPGFVAIVFTSTSNFQHVVGVEISDAGVITDPYTEDYVFYANSGGYATITPMGSGYLVVAFKNNTSGGALTTLLMDAAGLFNATVLDTATFDTVIDLPPYVIMGTGNIYVIVYSGPDADGWVKSISIESPTAGFAQHILLLGIG